MQSRAVPEKLGNLHKDMCLRSTFSIAKYMVWKIDYLHRVLLPESSVHFGLSLWQNGRMNRQPVRKTVPLTREPWAGKQPLIAVFFHFCHFKLIWN